MFESRKILIAVAISIIIHLGIICALYWINNLTSESALGEKRAIISVDVISDLSESGQRAKINSAKKDVLSKTALKRKTTLSKKARVEKEGTGSSGKIGTPGSNGTSNILSKIRAKIESAKHYPRMARKMGLTGRPTVVFEINPDGSIKYVKVTRSSGEKIIDNAAVATVKKAGPLPYYKGPITTALRYELK